MDKKWNVYGYHKLHYTGNPLYTIYFSNYYDWFFQAIFMWCKMWWKHHKRYRVVLRKNNISRRWQ